LPIFPLFRLCIDRIIFYTKSDISWKFDQVYIKK
jgi:hypothetical protein